MTEISKEELRKLSLPEQWKYLNEKIKEIDEKVKKLKK